MLGTSRFLNRFASFVTMCAAVMALSSPALAQKKKGDAPQDEASTPKQPTKEDVARAKQLTQEAIAAESNGELQTAIDKYQAAYEAVPDPSLLIRLGDAYRKNANNREAIDTWQKYIDTIGPVCGKFDEATCVKIDQQQGGCVPVYAKPEAAEGAEGEGAEGEQGEFQTCGGRYVDPAQQRIDTVEQELEDKQAAEAEEAKKKAAEAAELERLEEEQRRIEAAKLPMALSAVLMAGADDQATVIGRLLAGGMLRFGRFAPEAHIGFDAYLRATNDKGTQAQSITLIDLGARYAFQDEQFVGPFIGVNAGFGLFLGSPRDINYNDDPETCAGSDNNDCSVQVDKHLNGRIGFGWGFRSGDKTTVAARIDFNTWWYSIDDEQPDGVPLSQIDKPHLAYAVTLGLEFLRWR